MTEQQIRDYFGSHIIYRFDGEPAELQSALADSSINYLIAAYVTYFIADKMSGSDERITVFADNTQGGV